MARNGTPVSTVSTAAPPCREAVILAAETQDPRWLDRGFYVRNVGAHNSAKIRAARSDAETKRRRRDPLMVYLRRMLLSARKNASRRGHECPITEVDIWTLLERSGRRCEVTGVPFDLTPHPNGRAPLAPSLDRIDGTKGYALGNVRLVAQIANLAMNVWDADVLRAFIVKANASASPSPAASPPTAPTP